MIELSEEILNLRSPYRLAHVEDLTFSLITDIGQEYYLGFNESHDFLNEGAYFFFLENISGQHSAHDEKLLKTIVVLIEEFFRQNPMVLLYVCDSSDQRQAARNRLFRKWLASYEHAEQFIIYSKAIEGKSATYYTGLLARADNPAKEILIDVFNQFVDIMASGLARANGK